MKTSVALLFFLFVYLRLPFKHGNADNVIERKTYIVYMGDVSNTKSTLATEAHHDLLTSVLGENSLAKESLVYSYSKSFNGFAAKLRPEEAKSLSEKNGVVSVFLSQRRKLHTTRSWDFLGFPETVQRKISAESNVIIGMFDTGIWADSASFSDEGMSPLPSDRWKGDCVTGTNFTAGCNNKIVGAKFYRAESDEVSGDVLSPADVEGHGTHTASTAAGDSVTGASLYGIAEGTARGAVPSARLAVYKVCWTDISCNDVDLLSAFDDAIHDGVDIISLSLGLDAPVNYFEDPIAIGSFHAMKRGIVTSCSAGNSGESWSVVNVAPWILTVAANTIDRKFQTRLKLGNGKEEVTQLTINTDSSGTKPLIRAADAATEDAIAQGVQDYCDFDTLDETKVKGKILYCAPLSNGPTETVKTYGGAGVLWSLSGLDPDTAFTFAGPIAIVNGLVDDEVQSYLNSTGTHEAEISKTEIVSASAPFVASFSSRGPNYLSSKILKPDISAPGVDILAAYTMLTSVTESKYDDRFVNYNIISGTSMACPHVTGAAAYVKSFHLDWSPAAIKSALMTTAMEMKDESYNTSTYGREFNYGAGQIDPVKALDPGLVYDVDEMSYIRFLCDEGYTTEQLQQITDEKINCSQLGKTQGSDGINYPTMQHFMADGGDDPSQIVFYRTVTNVGPSNSVFKATVASGDGLNIRVDPDVLTFTDSLRKQAFTVVVDAPDRSKGDIMWTGSLVWSDSVRNVRSSIVLYAPESDNGR
ncbi:subtilisin-like protease SBT4.14 [Aristolochia californica]|uniref:subtilisin-like protease SBT4.14 n=1 Tax=Aristolochia californica TaxID=171875 RepID=UPI0035D59A21